MTKAPPGGHTGSANSSGVLSVVATPIGNLEDITYRAVRRLREVKALACEDTRHTRILLDHYKIPRPATCFSYHKHNEDAVSRRILGLLRTGVAVGLVSNAGYPGISDPGYLAVRRAVEAGYVVEVIPGASAVPSALISSGLPTGSYTFKGFPPRKPGQLRSFIEADATDTHTLIFYEAANRTAGLLSAAAEVLGDRQGAVCLELTKKFEQVHRGYLSDLATLVAAEPLRGEVTVVIAGNDRRLLRPASAT